MSRPRAFGLVLAMTLSMALSTTAAALDDTGPGGALTNRHQTVLWAGTLHRNAPPLGAVPECASTPCARFDLAVGLPGQPWANNAGGIQVAIRWFTLGDNLRLHVYQDGSPVASSDGVIATAQSVLIPSAGNGLYNVYIAFDPESVSDAISYEGLAEVEYLPRAKPARRLLPDLTVRTQRNVTFDTPPEIFFEPAPPAGQSCFASESADEAARTCLRFDQVVANEGEGALEVRFALPHDPGSTRQDVFQRIIWSDDPNRVEDRRAGEWEFHAVHGHYHYTGFTLSRLWAANNEGERQGAMPLRTSRKVGICLADIEIDAWAEKGDGPRTYLLPDCFFPTESDVVNDYLVQGITPGWADVYEWFVPDQYIEASGLPDGQYLLETVADPDGTILESDETNNCGSVLVRLTEMASGSPHATLLGPGPRC
jgi:hypothetical protein